jgi:nitrogen fixation protein NifU and related proteins
MDNLYKENILDHYKHPRNFGKLENANAKASDNLISCGDQLSMELNINKDVVKDIKFTGLGCAISMASASMLTEIVKGKDISGLKRLTRDDILKMLGVELTPTRVKCAMLSLEVLNKAILNYSHSRPDWGS